MKRSACLVLLLAAGCAGMDFSLESLGRVGAAAMPIGPEKEAEIGLGIAATIAGRYPVSEDEELRRYVSMVGHTVARQSIRGDEVAFRFGVLDTDDVNALAAPGGIVFVTRGALALMETEAELAGVLAHEIAHIDQKHVLEEVRRSSVVRSARDEAGLTGALLDEIAELGTGLLFTGLSREDEMEADSLGLAYAAGAGYRPDGLVRFLYRVDVHDADERGGALRELRATHPPTSERIERLEELTRRSGVDSDAGRDLADRFQRMARTRMSD